MPPLCATRTTSWSLTICIPTSTPISASAKAVDGVTFDVPRGKTSVGVVGESGCGKSVTSLSLMQLVQRPQGQIVSGSHSL